MCLWTLVSSLVFLHPSKSLLDINISINREKTSLGGRKKKSSRLLFLELVNPVWVSHGGWKNLAPRNITVFPCLKEQSSGRTFHCSSPGSQKNNRHWRQRKSSGNKGKGKVEGKCYAQCSAIATGPIQTRIMMYTIQHIPWHLICDLKDNVLKATIR